ncbi:MAG TPA: hypothetical protein VJL28_08560 [Gemmatimonadaceae bacterium]|nr:hypothetical protein [Gemmatimonadaceae bacterium]
MTSYEVDHAEWVGVFASDRDVEPLALFSVLAGDTEAGRSAILWAREHLISYNLRDVSISGFTMTVGPSYEGEGTRR